MVAKALVSLLLLCALAECFYFDIKPSQEKCFKQDFTPGQITTGKVEVNPVFDDMSLQLKIIDSQNQIVHHNLDIRPSSTFAITSHTEEDYKLCFLDVSRNGNVRATKRTVKIELENSSDKKKDYDEIGRKEKLKPIEIELRKMEDTIATVKTDLAYMKNREARHRDTSESTNSRVAWLSFFSVCILSGLAGSQIFYLKKFFKSKKLI